MIKGLSFSNFHFPNNIIQIGFSKCKIHICIAIYMFRCCLSKNICLDVIYLIFFLNLATNFEVIMYHEDIVDLLMLWIIIPQNLSTSSHQQKQLFVHEKQLFAIYSSDL